MNWTAEMTYLQFISWKRLGKTFFLVGFLIFFCEVVIYYIVLLQCTWPQIETKSAYKPLKTMLLADTHLLGPRFGHWFDKLRREWQMYRTFQTAMSLHHPQVVFVLGDLFDEGQHCTEKEFSDYVKRFHSLFYVPEGTELYIISGNHDMGFHYRITKKLKERFEKAFNTSSVQLISIRGNIFVTLNSMAMQGDGCSLCKPAEKKLLEIAKILRCSKTGKEEKNCDSIQKLPYYSKPVFLQHFPLFRHSDGKCKEEDSAPLDLVHESFRETWDCLSKGSSEKVLILLDPRAAFTGHIHHGCLTVHREHIPEWTLSSFNWRNKQNPSFILATFAPDNFAVSKCYMPKENTVITMYIVGGVLILVWFYFSRRHLKPL